jgi:hypothetical protein
MPFKSGSLGGRLASSNPPRADRTFASGTPSIIELISLNQPNAPAPPHAELNRPKACVSVAWIDTRTTTANPYSPAAPPSVLGSPKHNGQATFRRITGSSSPATETAMAHETPSSDKMMLEDWSSSPPAWPMGFQLAAPLASVSA